MNICKKIKKIIMLAFAFLFCFQELLVQVKKSVLTLILTEIL